MSRGVKKQVPLKRRRFAERRRRGLGLGYYLLFVLATGIWYLHAVVPQPFETARRQVDQFAAPILEGARLLALPIKESVSRAGRLFEFDDELARLRQEVRELRSWKWRAQRLERQIKELRTLAKVSPRAGVGFVTAHVLAVSPGPDHLSVLINAGERQAVQIGDGVIGAEGIVGVVASVNRYSARVRLLDDPATRLDVVVGRDGVLAQTRGAHGGLAALDFHDPKAVVREGDEVVTSGREPGIPRGLKVGMVVRDDGRLRVAPFSVFGRLEYVSILLGHKTARDRLVATPRPARVR